MRWGSLSPFVPSSGVTRGRHCPVLSSALLLGRFRSVHCLLYPDTPWCPANVVY